MQLFKLVDLLSVYQYGTILTRYSISVGATVPRYSTRNRSGPTVAHGLGCYTGRAGSEFSGKSPAATSVSRNCLSAVDRPQGSGSTILTGFTMKIAEGKGMRRLERRGGTLAVSFLSALELGCRTAEVGEGDDKSEPSGLTRASLFNSNRRANSPRRFQIYRIKCGGYRCPYLLGPTIVGTRPRAQ